MQRMLDLTVSIVNWNAGELIIACLNSVFNTIRHYSFEVCVVDNASRDSSMENIAKVFPRVKIIQNETNRGYARAHNQVLSIANSRYVLLLNPDCEIREGVVDEMIVFMDAHPDIGLAGCKVILPNHRISNTVVNFPTVTSGCWKLATHSFYPFNNFLKNVGMNKRVGLKIDKQVVEVDEAITGPFLLSRMDMIRDIGMLDERFFLFSEENDWCMRAKKRNWKRVYFHNKIVLHLLGKCREKAPPAFSEYHFCRSRLLFFRKHYGLLRTIALSACYSFFGVWMLLVEVLKKLIYLALDRQREDDTIERSKARLRAVFDTLFSLKNPSFYGKYTE